MNERRGNATERLQIKFRNNRTRDFYASNSPIRAEVTASKVPHTPFGVTITEVDEERRAKSVEYTRRTQAIFDRALELSGQGLSATEVFSQLDINTGDHH